VLQKFHGELVLLDGKAPTGTRQEFATEDSGVPF
jgi:hypothetical protein